MIAKRAHLDTTAAKLACPSTLQPTHQSTAVRDISAPVASTHPSFTVAWIPSAQRTKENLAH